jgi:FkbM family methyltransferase
MRTLADLQLGYENFSYDFHRNGEARVLRTLEERTTIRTVFDVGANTGEWSTMAVHTFPSAHVHAFEIVPQTALVCRSNTQRLERFTLNEVGLSDREGSDEAYVTEGLSVLATCVPDFSDTFHRIETAPVAVRTTTGDLYCERLGIESIDFLKIDVEGYEDKVLRGFESMLERGAVRAIQFEYGYVNIASRFLLKDFYDLLIPYGMAVGKVYPTYVDFRDYDHHHEDFRGPNYLAVRRREHELIRALEG